MASIKVTKNNKSNQKLYVINGYSVELAWPKDQIEKLFLFVNDLEIALVTHDITLFRTLSIQYNLRNRQAIFTLILTVFHQEFITFFVTCGLDFVKQGRLFTKKGFMIHICPPGGRSGSMGRLHSLINQAEERFLEEVTAEMKIAFETSNRLVIHKQLKALQPIPFFELAFSKLLDEFKYYLDCCAQEIILNQRELTWKSLWETAFSSVNSYYNHNYSSAHKDFFLSVVTYWQKQQDRQSLKTKIHPSFDKWILPYHDIQYVRKITLNFQTVKSPMKDEIKAYLQFYFDNGERPNSLSRRYANIIRITRYLQEIVPVGTSFLQASYIDVLNMLDVLQQSKTKDGHPQYSLKTIQGSISEARLLFDWLKHKKQKDDLKNPFRRLKLYNVNSFIENADYIPDMIVEQMSSVIHECPLHVQRIWMIMMNTGMRISEVLHLKDDCLDYRKEENTYYLRFILHKTLKHRRRAGLEDYQTIPLLNEQVINCIVEQIAYTEELRQKEKTPYIFIRLSRGNRKTEIRQQYVSRYQSSDISSSINNCIKRRNICDHEGNLWRYSHHQCRKTVAVNLLSSGGSISEVGEILGHLAEKSTRQYYQDVDAKKIAELDQELFERLFNTISEEIKEAYTPIELEDLKKEILLGSRETPEGHGSCLKHVSFGPCKKRSCVGCSLLLTGPQKLTMWEKLRGEQQKYLKQLQQEMLTQGIRDYEGYRDYQSELHLLSLYEDTIIKIECFIDERTVKNENKQ